MHSKTSHDIFVGGLLFFVSIKAIAKDQYQQYVVYKARYNAVCEAEFKKALDRGDVTQDDHDEFVRNYVNEEIVADLMSETMSSSELVEVFAGKLGKDDSNVIVSFLKRLLNGIKNVFNSKDEFPNKFSDIIGMFEGAVKNGVDNTSDARYNNTRYKLVRLDGVNVFSPYNESGSDTNERATRWTHKRDVEDYTQRILYHKNIRYLVEKDSSLSLGYRILKRVTNKEYAYLQKLNDVKTAMEDNYGRNTDRQQGNVRGIRADSGNREIAESPDRGNGNGGVADKHNGKTSSTQGMGGEQNAERRIDVERGRASERSVEDTQGKVKKKFALSYTVEKTPELNGLDSHRDSVYNENTNNYNIYTERDITNGNENEF